MNENIKPNSVCLKNLDMNLFNESFERTQDIEWERKSVIPMIRLLSSFVETAAIKSIFLPFFLEKFFPRFVFSSQSCTDFSTTQALDFELKCFYQLEIHR